MNSADLARRIDCVMFNASTLPVRTSFALRKVPLFEGLADDTFSWLTHQCQLMHIEPHRSLVMRSDAKRDVFFLLTGSLLVTTYSHSGRQVSFRDAKPGDWFGDIAAIDGQARSADVITLESSTVANLRGEDFMKLVLQEPLVAQRVLHRLASSVRQLSQRVIELSTLDVRSRLHSELLRVACAVGVEFNRVRINPAPRHEALASRISTNREQVTRELAVLYREGLAVRDGRALLLPDVKRLARLVAESQGICEKSTGG